MVDNYVVQYQTLIVKRSRWHNIYIIKPFHTCTIRGYLTLAESLSSCLYINENIQY